MIKALRSLGILGLGEIARAVRPDVTRPTAYRGPWPIRSHRTLAEVWAAEVGIAE